MDDSTVSMKVAEDLTDLSSDQVLDATEFDLSQFDLMADLDPGFLEWDAVPVSEDH